MYWTPLLWGWPAHLVLVWTVVTPRGSFTSLLFQVSGASWPSCAISFLFPAHASSSPLCHLPSIPAKCISAPQGPCNWHYGKGKWFSNCCLFSEVLRTPVCVCVCECSFTQILKIQKTGTGRTAQMILKGARAFPAQCGNWGHVSEDPAGHTVTPWEIASGVERAETPSLNRCVL